MSVNAAATVASQIVAGLNPIIPFNLTYEVHNQLDKMGCFTKELSPTQRTTITSRSANRELRYRVFHGNDFYTQAEWKPGMVTPFTKTIPKPNKVA